MRQIKRFINQNKSIRVIRDKWQGIKEVISGRLHVLRDKGVIYQYPISPYQKKSPEKFKYQFAITAIIKNEERYIEEWIEFHRLIGCQKFYIYDNESIDNTTDILEKYQKKGLVDLVTWPDMAPFLNKQLLAYTHAINKIRGRVKWVAFIDIDEFIFSPTHKNITRFLEKYEEIPAIMIAWDMFTTSGHKKRPNGLVIENYTKKLDMNHPKNTYKPYFKSIVQPHRITMVDDSHHFRTDAQNALGYDENKNPIINERMILKQKHIKLHHYYTKSEQDWKERLNRKSDVRYQFSDNDRQIYIYRCQKVFKKIHHYQIEDKTLFPFIPELRKRMQNNL